MKVTDSFKCTSSSDLDILKGVSHHLPVQITFSHKEKPQYLIMRKIVLLFIISSLLFSCSWIIEDKNNPYNFTATRPALKEVVGEYRISETSRKQLNIPKEIAETIQIKLDSNRTFEFKNIPENWLFKNLKEFKTTNAEGNWDIKQSQGYWVLSLTIISKFDGNKTHISNQFHLNNSNPPYQILKLVGNDDLEGIIFDKN